MTTAAAFDRAALPPIEHAARVDAVRSALAAGGTACEVFVYTDLIDVR